MVLRLCKLLRLQTCGDGIFLVLWLMILHGRWMAFRVSWSRMDTIGTGLAVDIRDDIVHV
jgi:hypothetical protein